MNNIIVKVLKFIFDKTFLAGVLGMLVSFFIFKMKYEFDKKQYYEKIIVEKLEVVISPLLYHFKSSKDDEIIFDDKCRSILNDKIHLLKKELYEDLFQLEIIENNIKNDISIELVKKEEYIRLKKWIIKELSKEHAALSKLYEKDFNTYRVNKLRGIPEKTLFFFIGLSKVFVYTFFICILIYFMYQDFKGIEIIEGSEIFSVAIMFVSLIAIIVFGFGIFMIGGQLIGRILDITSKKSKRYKANTRVPETGIYECRICKKRKMYYQYSTFDYCLHSFNKNSIIRFLFVDYEWEFRENISQEVHIKECFLS